MEGNKMGYVCPVCNYPDLDEEPYNKLGYGSYEICSCCGFQFGLHDFPDEEKGIKNWREKWIEKGCQWFDPCLRSPLNWDTMEQLNRNNDPIDKD